MVAQELNISPDTAKGHIRGLCEQLGVFGSSPAAAVAAARRRGILPAVKPRLGGLPGAATNLLDLDHDKLSPAPGELTKL
jgi:hypothetical protein